MAETQGIHQKLDAIKTSARVAPTIDGSVDDLTRRIRQPKRWMLRHPMRAARRRRRLAFALTVIGVAAAVFTHSAARRYPSAGD